MKTEIDNQNVTSSLNLTGPNPVIITGMYSSGLFSVNKLIECALFEGESLDVPAVKEFQVRVLSSYGLDPMLPSISQLFPDKRHQSEARALLASLENRFNGWSNEESVLFLDFWKSLLPTAVFIFVYRHPIEALLYHISRYGFNSDENPLSTLYVWTSYNKRILEFAKMYPDRSLLINACEMFRDTKGSCKVLASKLGRTLSTDMKSHYNQTNPFFIVPDEIVQLLQRKFASIVNLYDCLQAMALLTYKSTSKEQDNVDAFWDIATDSISIMYEKLLGKLMNNDKYDYISMRLEEDPELLIKLSQFDKHKGDNKYVRKKMDVLHNNNLSILNCCKQLLRTIYQQFKKKI